MKVSLNFAFIAIFALFGSSGCSTKVEVSSLNPNLKADEVVDGLPFRARERYQIKLYRFNGLEYEPAVTKDQTASLANLDQLYVLRVNGSPISDGEVTVKLRSDNTLESVKVVSKSRGQEALTAFGKGDRNLEDAEATRDKGAEAKDEADESERVASEDRTIVALSAKHAYFEALDRVAALPESATRLERTEAEHLVEKTRMIANNKARQAGLQANY